MTAPDPSTEPDAARGPVGHTEARHVALATVAAGTVTYDREHAQWMLRGAREGQHPRELRGAEQRTLRDLLDSGLIAYTSGDGPATVRLSPRGNGALVFWGASRKRLRGARTTR